MEQSMLKKLYKHFVYGTISFILLLGISFIIIKFNDLNLKDLLFIEGIVIVIGAILATIEDNSMGLFLRGFEEIEISNLFNINKNKTVRTSINIDTTSFSVIIVGLITLIVSFII